MKEYWFITCCGDVDVEPDDGTDTNKECKEIGNYFNTREEADQAVKKLKAWKLLKDECKIKFDGIIRDEKAMVRAVYLSYDEHPVTFDRARECNAALYLLFGGKE